MKDHDNESVCVRCVTMANLMAVNLKTDSGPYSKKNIIKQVLTSGSSDTKGVYSPNLKYVGIQV